MQFVGVRHVEDHDVAVAGSDPPHMQNLTLLLEGSPGLKFARAKLLNPFRRDVVGNADQNTNMEQHQRFSFFVGFDRQQWALSTQPKPDIWVP